MGPVVLCSVSCGVAVYIVLCVEIAVLGHFAAFGSWNWFVLGFVCGVCNCDHICYVYDGRILSCSFFVDSFSVSLFCFKVGSFLGSEIEVGSMECLGIEVGSVVAVWGGMVVSWGRGLSLLVEAFVDCLVSYLSLLLYSNDGMSGAFAGASGLGTLVRAFGGVHPIVRDYVLDGASYSRHSHTATRVLPFGYPERVRENMALLDCASSVVAW